MTWKKETRLLWKTVGETSKENKEGQTKGKCKGRKGLVLCAQKGRPDQETLLSGSCLWMRGFVRLSWNF